MGRQLASFSPLVEEVFHRGRNFYDVCLNREMSCIKEFDLRVRQVFSKGLWSGGNEERIVLAPDRKQRRFGFAEIFLKFGIELYVRCVIQKQIELNLFVPWPFEQSRNQRVWLRRNSLRIRYALRVLPARSTR